jgi:uncharacterized membrane protein YeaQ/YmgE (transglycosylase-associated protein family)
MISLILYLVFGLIVGAVARLLVPGRDSGGWVFSMLIGVAGAYVGGFLGRVVGIYGDNQPAGFIMSVIGAMVLVAIYHALRRSAHA